MAPMKDANFYPENITDCYKVIDQVSTERDHYKALYEQLRRHRYGQRSEKLSADQLALFDALFAEEPQDKEPETESVTVPTHQRHRPKRQALPEHLPRERVEHDLPEKDKVCDCGCQMHRIGEEITEKLEVIPAQFKVIQHVRFKYGCRRCECGVKIPALPPMLIPKSIVTPSLLAMIIADKFESHLPLHRQAQRFDTLGMSLPRNTMASWVIEVAQLCEPLIALMKQDLLKTQLLHADESHLRVLSEDKQKSYLWYYYGRVAHQHICCIDFQIDRCSVHPTTFLQDYSGYMMTDAYSGYNKLFKKDTITATYCWAHARRKFEAVPLPKKGSKKVTLTMEILNLIKKLYSIEREIKDQPLNVIDQQRQLRSKPLLDEIKRWLERYQPTVPPKTSLGKAISYLHGRWPQFVRYIDEPFLSIDNNALERQIRPLAVGRHNWLFSASEADAHATAVFYSLVATCKLNGDKAQHYLKHLFKNIRTAHTESELRALLPYSSEIKLSDNEQIIPTVECLSP